MRVSTLLRGFLWRGFALALILPGTAPAQSPDIITGQSTPGDIPPPLIQIEPLGSPALKPRIQGGVPAELILPPPSDAAIAKANRFVEATINPDLPLELALGRPKILQLTDAPLRIYLPDEAVVTVDIIDTQSGRELAVTGRQVGSTTLTMWFRDESQPSGHSIVSYLVRVYADPLLTQSLQAFEQDINQKFPNSFVELDELGGQLIVRGQARDAIELGRILNLLAGARGARPVSGQTSQVARIGDISTVSFISPLEQIAAADDISLLDPTALAEAGIVNLMKVPGEQQVMLRVTVAEVNRSAARSVGLNFNAITNNGSFSNTTGNVTGNILALLDGGDIELRIEALRRLSLSRTLAEPNLVAMNGQPANFQAGGQFPIPVIAAGGAANNLQGVQFVPFGVQLQFVPLIQDRDVVRLQVQANVSTRDESLGANIGGGGGGGGGGGTSVPGLNSRNFSTTVELRSGQTLAVAGLLQTNFGASSDRVPFFGDLPLLGFLGGVNRTSAAEQELVILVTPELVAPVDACMIPGLPGDDVYEPTDIEFYLSNRLESRRAKDFRSPARTDYAKLRMPDKCCPDRFLIGAVGPTDRCCNQLAAVPHRPLTTQAAPTFGTTEYAPVNEEVAP